MSERAAAAPLRVLVTDGETRQALALVRALAPRGVRLEVLAARPGSLAGASRHAAAEHVVPDVEADPAGWARAVAARLEEGPETLLVPTTEPAIGTLHQHGIAARARVATPPRDAYELACDKWTLLARAAEAGFAVPQTVLVEEPESLRETPAGMSLPLVVKARRSRFLVEGRWRRGTVQRVDEVRALAGAAADPGLRGGAIVQPFVAGRGEGLFFAADRGRVVAAFAHRRLREKPPTGGVGVLLESATPEPGLLASAERLVAALGWHGVGMLEFRRAPDGHAWLMELNPRLWGSLQLAVEAGADFPGLVLALHAGAAMPAFAPRAGVRTRWLLSDFDQLLITWRRRAVREQIGTTRRAALAAFLAGFRTRDEIWRWDDPRPFARELAGWVRALGTAS